MAMPFVAWVAVVVLGGIVGVEARQTRQSAPSPAVDTASPGRATVPPPSPEATARATEVLAAARKALGGDRLAAVKTIVTTGRTRRLRGDNIQPIEFEISIELPDKYLRKDEFPAEESDPTSTGFAGEVLLQLPLPATPVGRPGGPPPPTPQQLDAQRRTRLTTLRQDVARLALGIFADSPLGYPLTFAFAARAEAPQGTADVLDVTGEGNFRARLFVNGATHLPIMVSWQQPPTNVIVTVPGAPPPATVAPGAAVVVGPAPPATDAPQADKDKYAQDVVALRTKTQATPVEHRLYFADYREVDGVLLPFRLRRAIGADTTEETTFDRFRVNTRIDPRKFEPAR
jgi:hypothetical protein